MELKDDNGKVVAKISAVCPDNQGCEEGIWVEIQAQDGTRPTLCLVKAKPPGDWFLGVFRDSQDIGLGCDFAISFDKKDGPYLQVVKGEEIVNVSLFDLLKAFRVKNDRLPQA